MATAFFNPYPKYLQIREVLLKRLEREMKVGQQLPTEHALCEEFGVSRETVRQALGGLERDGLISRRRGQGTFVAKRPARVEQRLTGLAEDFSELKFDTRAKVLERGPVAAPPDVAAITRTPFDEMVYRISRLRSFEGKPLALHDAFLPLELGARVARLDLRRTSIVHELRNTLRLAIREEHQRVEAVPADAGQAELLDVPLGAPLLYLVRHFIGPEENSIVLFRSWYRADRYYYTVRLAQEPRRAGTESRRRADQAASRAPGREPTSTDHKNRARKPASTSNSGRGARGASR